MLTQTLVLDRRLHCILREGKVRSYHYALSFYHVFRVFSSLFLIVALYSYQSLDPASLTSSGYQLNQAGFIGAILADFFPITLRFSSLSITTIFDIYEP